MLICTHHFYAFTHERKKKKKTKEEKEYDMYEKQQNRESKGREKREKEEGITIMVFAAEACIYRTLFVER